VPGIIFQSGDGTATLQLVKNRGGIFMSKRWVTFLERQGFKVPELYLGPDATEKALKKQDKFYNSMIK